MKTVPEMRQDALRILRAALAAADPRAAVLRACGVKGDALVVDGERYPLGRGRVIVVGAGKASAPMAAAIASPKAP